MRVRASQVSPLRRWALRTSGQRALALRATQQELQGLVCGAVCPSRREAPQRTPTRRGSNQPRPRCMRGPRASTRVEGSAQWRTMARRGGQAPAASAPTRGAERSNATHLPQAAPRKTNKLLVPRARGVWRACSARALLLGCNARRSSTVATQQSTGWLGARRLVPTTVHACVRVRGWRVVGETEGGCARALQHGPMLRGEALQRSLTQSSIAAAVQLSG